jgi:hypothetical protein
MLALDGNGNPLRPIYRSGEAFFRYRACFQARQTEHENVLSLMTYRHIITAAAVPAISTRQGFTAFDSSARSGHTDQCPASAGAGCSPGRSLAGPAG